MINKNYNEDCLLTMAKMPDNYLDLTVTSPPYDSLRSYKGNEDEWCELVWCKVIQELYRVTKEGGVVVWVVGDATVNGGETGTSFKQALHAMKCGFKLHDTMIYKKNSYPFPPKNRYYQQFEYMFVFSKGSPKTYNIQEQETVANKTGKGNAGKSATTRNVDGTTSKMKYELNRNTRKMDNVWDINTGYMRSTKDKFAYQHPAMFPEYLSEMHIISWSNEGDLVYDPFMGSGTTAKMAILNKRNWIGSEMSREYCEIIKERVDSATPPK